MNDKATAPTATMGCAPTKRIVRLDTRRGRLRSVTNKQLKSTLVECARAAIRHKDSYYYAKYCKIAARRGGNRALVAVAHSMILAIFYIIIEHQHFCDLGADFFNTKNAERIMKRNIDSLQALGFQVSRS